MSFEGYKRYIQWRPLPANSKILQIYSRGLEYSLVSDDYKQCHNFVWCKDFLHDVMHATLNNRTIDIYKFRYNPSENPHPSLNKIRLMITNSKDKRLKKKIPNCLDFLNQIEEKLKIKKSIVRQCWMPQEPYRAAGVFMFEGSKRWIQAPPMLSLYSLLLRVGLSHKVGDSFTKTINGIKNRTIRASQKYDRKWLESIEPALDKLFRLGDRKIFHKNIQENYPKRFVIDVVHHRLGIIGFSADILYAALGESVIVPHWHFTK